MNTQPNHAIQYMVDNKYIKDVIYFSEYQAGRLEMPGVTSSLLDRDRSFGLPRFPASVSRFIGG